MDSHPADPASCTMLARAPWGRRADLLKYLRAPFNPFAISSNCCKWVKAGLGRRHGEAAALGKILLMGFKSL